MDKLKQQFYYTRKKFFERLQYEAARDNQNFLINKISFFKNFDYKKIYTEGITRNVKGRTIRITGREAIETMIASYRARYRVGDLKKTFIERYIYALEEVGVPLSYRETVRRLMSRLSADTISYMYREGKIPEIEYWYDPDMLFEMLEELINNLRNPPREQVREERTRAKKSVEIQRTMGINASYYIKKFTKS